MNINRPERRVSHIGLWLVLLLGLGAARVTLAEEVYMEHERYGAWELAFQYNRVGSDSIPGVTRSALDTDGGSGWGTSIGYNLNNKLLLTMAFTGTRQDYATNVNTTDGNRTLNGELDVMGTHFNGTWHFLPGGITPFVTLGIGWANVDSNIRSRIPQTECWWDPWWGYTCSDYYPTFNQTNTSASAAVGMRWDFHTRFFTRVSYGKLWLNLDDGNGAAPAVLRFEIGMRH